VADPPEPFTPGDDPRDRFLVLVVRYFDGDLDPGEVAELNARLLADPECRRAFAEYGTMGCLIREALGAEPATADPRRPDAAPPARPRRRRRVVLLAGVAGLLAAAAALVVTLRPAPQPPLDSPAAVVAAVEPLGGDVRVVTPDGTSRVVAARTDLRSGDTVRTEALRATATVVYPDGTRLALAGETAVSCTGDEGKRVVLHQGAVGATVRPQPADRPLVVATPAARVEVRGTEFYCHVLPDRTEVSVTRGSVRVVRTSDGEAVEVPEGKRVLAGARLTLAVEDIPRRTDTWDLDFERGLPDGMHRARFVTEGLPRGSKGGAAAVPSTSRGAEGFFEIASPEAWQTGLFAFHPDSHLHVTYTMDRPDWVNVFVCARGPDPAGPHVGNYLFNEPEFHTGARPGRWRTAVIPLATLRRAGTTGDARPGADEVPYLVLFSSDGDRGLVIDRVWVTRGGPGVVRYEDVE
jgi:ferric-dicitrate binding protein FerR (iron transport regulator)